MRRRSLLAALAAGLAGCGGSGGGSRDPFDVPSTTPPPATDDPTTTARRDFPQGVVPESGPSVPEGLRRAVTGRTGSPRRLVFAGGSLPDEQLGARLTAGFLRPPTPEGPARVWIGFTNDTGRDRAFTFGPSPPFSQYWARGTEGYPSRDFLLVPDDGRAFPYEDVTPTEPTDGRWVATGTLGAPTGPVGETELTLAAGESIAGTYRLLVHPDADLGERGNYRFAGAPWTDRELLLVDYHPSLSDPGDSRFDPDRDVPRLPSSPGVVWYHEVASRDSARTFVRPGRERFGIGEEAIELGIENYAPYTVPVGPWRLFKRQGDSWRPITPWGEAAAGLVGPGVVRPVQAGGRVNVWFFPTASPVPDGDSGRSVIRVGGLGAGTYALRFAPALIGGPDASTPLVVDGRTDGGRIRSSLAVLLEVTGDPATVTPTRNVSSVEREGATVTVRTYPTVEYPDPAEGPELVVERIPPGGSASNAIDAGTVLPEQVNQFPALRNAFSNFEEGVRTVRVVTAGERATKPLAALGAAGVPLAVRFSGEHYEARAVDVVGGSSDATTEG